MKKKINRVALYFATYADSELNSFAILVIVCLKTNPLFPNLPVTIIALTALQVAFQNALAAAAQGGTALTAAKNEAREALVSALRQIGAYIQSLALANVSDILSSGYDVVNTNKTQSPLTQPVFTLDNSMAGQLNINLQAVLNAKAYQVQYYAGTGAAAWQDAGIFPNTKGISLTNLTSGTVYNVHIRAVGGSTQYSQWSATMSLMAM
jgi:hypothetical protein